LSEYSPARRLLLEITGRNRKEAAAPAEKDAAAPSPGRRQIQESLAESLVIHKVKFAGQTEENGL